MIKRIKNIIGTLGIILSIMGLVTFSLFIMEEALQTVMFGGWAAQDAKRWDLVQKGCDINHKINKTMKVVNWTFGWIQPFAFLSYRAYGDATDYYLECLEARVVAHAPELQVGRMVSVYFTPREIQYKEGEIWLVNGNMAVVVKEKPEQFPLVAKGMVEKRGDLFVVNTIGSPKL